MIALGLSCALALAFAAGYLRAHRRLVLVARAAHELRNPLFALQLGLHGLGGDPARGAALELELARAVRALDDLAAAHAGARAPDRRELIDLTALVRRHADAWEALAGRYGAQLCVEPALAGPATAVFADPLRLAQACANLIGNAAEHAGGVIRVRVRADDRRVRIEVADDGPGLPMSVGALTATARARRGRRGHGLAIAAAIAEHHGGRLSAAPSDGGARLMLDMPAAHEPVVA